ncbi:MAG: transcriptional repressor LexA, partial [Alphaproteobacteria bacterium]|nr:transcriptional repressor LexA [Alphaproteobacteria bacterium]
MLTFKQNQLLSFLIKKIEENGVSPSYEEICKELSLKSKSGIHRIVKSLEERGYIERLKNRARAIAPKKNINGQPYFANVISINKKINDLKLKEKVKINNIETNRIPLLGKIAAGTPLEAISNNDKFIDVPSSDPSFRECYALYVEGDSMIDEGILDGDIVIIEKKQDVKNGDIVVALIDKEEATLKKFRKRGDTIALEPANKSYKTQIYGPDRIIVQGKLKTLV